MLTFYSQVAKLFDRPSYMNYLGFVNLSRDPVSTEYGDVFINRRNCFTCDHTKSMHTEYNYLLVSNGSLTHCYMYIDV